MLDERQSAFLAAIDHILEQIEAELSRTRAAKTAADVQMQHYRKGWR